jgi:hypothetical protein
MCPHPLPPEHGLPNIAPSIREQMEAAEKPSGINITAPTSKQNPQSPPGFPPVPPFPTSKPPTP